MHTTEKPCQRPVTHGRHTWRTTKAGRATFTCPGAAAQPYPLPNIELRRGVFDAGQLRALGWGSLTEAARSMGLSHTTLRRVVAGEMRPGEAFIAAVLRGTGRTFDALFRVR